jgi:branched-chain amino acid transport system substrate-binding protein
MWGSVGGRLRALRAGVALGVVALVLASCGANSSSDAGGGSGSTGTTSAAKSKGGKVKVAISAPTSGAVAAYAPYGTAAKAYLDYINEQGGVNGYTFDSSVLDNKLTPTGAVTNARTIVRDDPFVMYMVGSPTFAAAATVLKQSAPDLPMFTTASAGVLAKAGLKNAFGMNLDYSAECFFEAKYAKEKLNATNIAIIYEDDPIGQPVEATCPDYAKKIGVGKVTAIPVTATATDFGPVAAKLRSSGAEVALVYATANPLAGTQKAAQAVGYDGKWMTFSSNGEAYVQAAGKVAEGLYVDQWLQQVGSDTPEAQVFRDEVEKRMGKKAVTGASALGWTAAAVIVEGVRKATDGGKELTREGFVNAVAAISNQQLGMGYELTYAGTDHSTPTTTARMFQVKDGKLVQTDGPSPLPTE